MKKNSSDIFNEKDFPVSFARRAVFSGNGVDIDEVAGKRMVAIVNSQSDITPGHMHLSMLSKRVSEGIHAGGDIPFEFNVPAPCDGVALGNEGMRYILAQRELIADMIEVHIRSMRFDAMVMIASCDKIVPAMLIAAARLDIPTIFLTGGTNAMQIRFEAGYNGSVSTKNYPEPEMMMACGTCATAGACEFMGTASTFQCLTEAIGLSMPGTANIPAFHVEKLRVARKVGLRICRMIDEGLTARKIMTDKALENALIVDLAIGGSTNATLHLPAIADALELHFPLEKFNEFNRRIPTVCHFATNGPYGVLDLFIAGGIPAVMKRLVDDLHLDALNASGETIGAIADLAIIKNEKVIPPRETPHLPEGGTVVLTGNLAPEGAVVKQSAVDSEMLQFSGPARIFESEADCLDAIRENSLKEGEVLVIRNEGPKGGPGMPEMLAVSMAITFSEYNKLALITDGRFSGATSGPCIGHISPEAFEGGPIAILEEGDQIEIDIPNRKLSVKLSDEEIRNRLSTWKPKQRDIPAGYMRRYIQQVTSAARGAVLA